MGERTSVTVRVEQMEIVADVASLPRYERPPEQVIATPQLPLFHAIPYDESEAAIAASALSQGSKQLLRGLLRLGATRVFPGGGAGIEYGSLLKTAVRPEFVGPHVREAAEHLQQARVDVVLVPGMSGYPVGAMYSAVAGIPAILLKKQRLSESRGDYPPGAFVIPSYTGEGDVVMSADLDAVQDIVDGILGPQIALQADEPSLALTIRVAGADDIIDKATMSQAVGESAVVLGRASAERCIRRHRNETGDARPIAVTVEVVAWVTPIIKGYNRPHDHLLRLFNLRPFAGINVTSLHLDPRAIGVDGLGVVAFAADYAWS
ncbi:MAG: hypothetical protein ACJ789_15790 [Thermomicrobiales bacterium]